MRFKHSDKNSLTSTDLALVPKVIPAQLYNDLPMKSQSYILVKMLKSDANSILSLLGTGTEIVVVPVSAQNSVSTRTRRTFWPQLPSAASPG